MKNCPKCGNQLQEGVTSCPICGTNILENTEAVASAPAQATETLGETPTVAPAPAPQPEQPAAPVQAPEAPAAAPAEPAPTAEAIAPTVDPVTPSTPIPSIPTSLTGGAKPEEAAKTAEDSKKNVAQKPKKGVNKGIIFGFLILVLIGVGAYVFLNNGSSVQPSNNNPGTPSGNLVGTKVSSNGFKFNLITGWIINEDGENVIVINENSTVAIRLVYSKANLADVTKDQIDEILSDNELYKETVINELKLTGRDAFQVNTMVNDIPVQVYFINGGSDLTLGATVVYQTKESKEKFEAEVTEMIGSLSYSNDSIKALDTMSSYSEMFSVYDKIMGKVELQQNPIPDLPSTPESENENPTTEEPENKPVEPENNPDED